MTSLLSIFVGLMFVTAISFWLLFFLVVKVRIADRGLVVDEAPRFSFLWEKWPYEEMKTYRLDLSQDERRRPVNRFLLNAQTTLRILFVVYLAVLILYAISA